jgi:hypothetical protein
VQIANALSEAGLWEVSALEFQGIPQQSMLLSPAQLAETLKHDVTPKAAAYTAIEVWSRWERDT